MSQAISNNVNSSPTNVVTSSAVEALRRRGGAARYVELKRWANQLPGHVIAGEVVRFARGCYSLPGARSDLVAAVGVDGVVSCVSALHLHGVPVPGDRSVVHVSVPANRGTHGHRPKGLVRHFESVERFRGARIATKEDALARAASCLPYLDAVAVLGLGCSGKAAANLDSVLAAVARTSRGLADDLALDVDRAARSLQETAVRLALRAAGWHVLPGAQVVEVGEVDLLVEGWIIVEIDGFAYHSGRKEYRADRRRDRRAVKLGFTVLRYAFEDADPTVIAEDVRDLLAMDSGPRRFGSRVPERVRLAITELRRRAASPEMAHLSIRARRAVASAAAGGPEMLRAVR